MQIIHTTHKSKIVQNQYNYSQIHYSFNKENCTNLFTYIQILQELQLSHYAAVRSGHYVL